MAPLSGTRDLKTENAQAVELFARCSLLCTGRRRSVEFTSPYKLMVFLITTSKKRMLKKRTFSGVILYLRYQVPWALSCQLVAWKPAVHSQYIKIKLLKLN